MKLTRQTLQALRGSLLSDVMMMHSPVVGQWLATFEAALSDAWIDPKQLRAALGLRDEIEPVRVTREGVAVIPIAGMIRHKVDVWVRWGLGTSNLQVAAETLAVRNNPKVRGVVYNIDSPGGLAIGNEEASRQIFDARGDKPILSSVNGFGASAAYYLGSAADKIYASASSITPSVGTMLTHLDYSEHLAKYGVKATTITHGVNKGTGNAYEPLSPKAKELMQQFVNGHGEQFVAAVARHRGITVDEVTKNFGGGWIFSTAEQAKAAGVIDGVANLDDVIAMVASNADAAQPTAGVAISPRSILARDDLENAIDNALDSMVPTGMLGVNEFTAGIDVAGLELQSSIIKPTNQTTAAVEPQSPSVRAETSATSTSQSEHVTVNKRIKAALYALGLVDAQDAGDDVCNAALNAFYLAGHRTRPQEDQKIITDLAKALAGPGESQQQQQQTNSPETPKTVNAAEVEEQMLTRQKEIKASAKLLKIPEQVLSEVLDANLSVADAREKFMAHLAKQEQPLDDPGRIEAGAAQHDKLVQVATAVILNQAGKLPAGEKPPEGFDQHRNASAMHFVRADLQARGVRFGSMETNEEIALKFLQADQGLTVLQSGGNYLRPGDFPNFLSNLMGKILDQAILTATPTYPQWTNRIGDVADFKPRTIMGMGNFDELNLVEDDEESESLNADEEVVGWIKADRYNGKAGLTPVMVANNELDGWVRLLMSLAVAHENTLNRLCVDLIASNPPLIDGTNLFHADHKNLVDSGGAPSAAQADDMWEQWFQQTDLAGKTVRTPPTKFLYPALLDAVVRRNFSPFAGMVESKQAATDDNLNIYRGQFELIREPELDSYSTKIWYWLADPNVRQAIVHMFMQGYGRGGRRTTWFDPDRETRYYKMEGRFGAANAGFRGVQRNDGE